jgi:hypothetical protein
MTGKGGPRQRGGGEQGQGPRQRGKNDQDDDADWDERERGWDEWYLDDRGVMKGWGMVGQTRRHDATQADV